jgi:hypothetical protein
MGVTTPKEIDAIVAEFCAEISLDAPVFFDVTPLLGLRPGECFYNNAHIMRARGGETVYGWIIWYRPGFYIEAEHHAVWRSPNGDLFDYTPTPDREKRILFLPDPSAVYDGRVSLPNHHKMLIHDTTLQRMFRAATAMQRARKSIGADGRQVTCSTALVRDWQKAQQAFARKFGP